jgi:hypothetical protein
LLVSYYTDGQGMVVVRASRTNASVG